MKERIMRLVKIFMEMRERINFKSKELKDELIVWMYFKEMSLIFELILETDTSRYMFSKEECDAFQKMYNAVEITSMLLWNYFVDSGVLGEGVEYDYDDFLCRSSFMTSFDILKDWVLFGYTPWKKYVDLTPEEFFADRKYEKIVDELI